MNFRPRPRLTYSNVIATIALFVALGGAAVAAGLPRNSVGPKQLKRGAVTSRALRRGAVNGRKIGPGAVSASKLAAGSVGGGALANGAVSATKLAKSSVTGTALANLGVVNGKLGEESVTTSKLKNKSVTLSKLSEEVVPLVGNLRSGQTLRGIVYASGSDPEGTGSPVASTGVSFQFPLAEAPVVNIVDPNSAATTACPGNAGADGKSTRAASGQLCIYITAKQNALTPTIPSGSANRLGFALETKSAGAKGNFSVVGQWAVTAP